MLIFTQNSQNCLFFYIKLTESNNNIYIEGVILLLNVAHGLTRAWHSWCYYSMAAIEKLQ